MFETTIASIGFVFAVISFIGGFRMVRKTDHEAEALMHKMNGYVTTFLYAAIALFSIYRGTTWLYITAWTLGFLLHILKIPLARKGLAVRYGGYMGALLLITWLVVIFTHLPV